MRKCFVLAALIALAAVSPAAFAQKLTEKRLSDGSGKIGIAAGWKMTSSGNGAVATAGPNGATMALGIPVPVVTRGVERLFPDVPNVFPGSLRVDFNDPVRAMMDVIATNGPKMGIRLTHIRAVEYIPWENGKAAYVHYTATLNGKSFEGFGLYAIQPIDNVQGLFYYSSVASPVADFKRQFPIMMAMWKSWSLSDATVKKRLQDAANTLAGVDVVGTMDSVMRERRAVAERAAQKFDVYIRQ